MNQEYIRIGQLRYDTVKLLLTDEKAPNFKEQLSLAEHRVFMYFWGHQSEIVSKCKLEEIGWNGRPVSPSSLSVLLCSLRKRISRFDNIEIKNISGEGYIFVLVEVDAEQEKESGPKPVVSQSPVESNTIQQTHPYKIYTYLLSFIVITLAVVYATLSVHFNCEGYGNSYYCYISHPSSEGRAKALLLKNQNMLIYQEEGSPELHYEKLN